MILARYGIHRKIRKEGHYPTTDYTEALVVRSINCGRAPTLCHLKINIMYDFLIVHFSPGVLARSEKHLWSVSGTGSSISHQKLGIRILKVIFTSAQQPL